MNLRTQGFDITGLPLGEAVEKSKLDWKVIPLPLDVVGHSRSIRVTGRQALMRSDLREGDPQPLDIVSKKYEVFQNEAILGMMYEAAQAAGVGLERAGSYDGGRRIWAVSEATTRSKAEVSVGDIISVKLRMLSGHEAGIALVAQSIVERLVCLNGSVSTRVSGRVSIPHRRKLNVFDLEAVKELFEESIGKFTRFVADARYLRSVKADRLDDRLVIADMLGPQILDAAVENTVGKARFQDLKNIAFENRGHQLSAYKYSLVGRELSFPEEVSTRHKNLIDEVVDETVNRQVGRDLAYGTLWNTYNGITSFVNHKAGRNIDSGLESAFVGKGAKTMDAAFERVMEYAQYK